MSKTYRYKLTAEESYRVLVPYIEKKYKVTVPNSIAVRGQLEDDGNITIIITDIGSS